jgi:hypothetical protein
MERTILYFDTPGQANTDATLRAARRRAQELGIRQVVVASTHGYTAQHAREVFSGLDVDLIAVSICAGFEEEGWTMTAAERAGLEALGITVLTCLHALGDDVSHAFGPAPNKVVRETLYRFCQGMKVAVEVAVMAADAGLLDPGREAIAIAGTGEGADTAIVVKPAYARKFQELEIREILAKPRSAV